MLGADRWNRVKELFQAALDQAPGERSEFIRRACGADEALRREVESLLAAHQRAGSFAEQPAIASLLPSAAPMPGSTEEAPRLRPGDRLGPYTISEFLAAGGMGEIYRAHDAKLGRDVAVKILPRAFTADASRMARLEREARLLAALSHPHIAAIYGFEEADGVRWLVLEMVEGETLADRLCRGALPLVEVFDIARQIAEALEAAHEKAIVHRDLKPANIRITPSGTVKVLDFGLAKPLVAEGSGADVPPLAAATAAGTREGIILGTPAYMSPEQARGQTVDRRTDIWAFGCVLYEMLTARPAFPGETISDTIAAILDREPDWDALRRTTPSAVRRLLRRCLTKDRRQRLSDAADARLEIEDAQRVPSGELEQVLPLSAPSAGWRRSISLAASIAAALVVGAMASIAVWTFSYTTPTSGPYVARLVLLLGEQLASLGNPAIAISPAGTHVAYVAFVGAQPQLYLRAIDTAESRPLAGTELATNPFFSPDGEWIGFFAQGKLKAISVAAGTIHTICDAPDARGGSWGREGNIYFAPTYSSGLLRVAAGGGTPAPVTTLDRPDGEVSHRWPQVLPGSRAVMYTVWTGPGRDERHVHVQRLDTGERKVVIQGDTGRYVETGHLLYTRGDELFAVPFDLDRVEVTGSPARLPDVVRGGDQVEGAQYAASEAGALIYLPGSRQRYERRLVWVHRDGRVVPLAASSRAYANPSLSPDGRLAAVQVTAGREEIWIYDFSRTTLTPFTTAGGSSQAPQWTPDGTRVAYRGTRAGFRNVWWRTVDDTSGEERLTTGENVHTPGSWSATGEWFVYQEAHPATADDIWAIADRGERNPRLIVNTPFSERSPGLSPDGRWLAYASNEPGRYEVFVQPFPGPGGRIQISADGGAEPVWSGDGRELFYWSGDRMMAVGIAAGQMLKTGTPRVLFEGRYVRSPNAVAGYDVSADGRFLLVQPLHPEPATNQIHIVLNWFEELRRVVPAAR